MIIKKCIVCGKIMECKTYKQIHRKYCSGKCSSKYFYSHNRRKRMDEVNSYRKRNPEKNDRWNKINRARTLLKDPKFYIKKSVKDYKKNPDIWHSRCSTRKWLVGYDKSCRICNNPLGQWHHEIYPRNKEEILQAYKNNQIYPLCKKCHTLIHIMDKVSNASELKSGGKQL